MRKEIILAGLNYVASKKVAHETYKALLSDGTEVVRWEGVTLLDTDPQGNITFRGLDSNVKCWKNIRSRLDLVQDKVYFFKDGSRLLASVMTKNKNGAYNINFKGHVEIPANTVFKYNATKREIEI